MSVNIPGQLLEANAFTIAEGGSRPSNHFCYEEIKWVNWFRTVTVIFKSLSKQTIGNYFLKNTKMKLRKYLLLGFCNISHKLFHHQSWLSQYISHVKGSTVHTTSQRRKTEGREAMQLIYCWVDLKLIEKTIKM